MADRTRSPRWLITRHRRSEAFIRLYCFPHSGGSAGEFARWGDDLDDIEVWGVQLPGRGSRLDEPPYTRVDELVAELADQADFAAPFAFFGHSLGAVLAFETARALRERGRPAPVRLVLSACQAPHLPRDVPAVSHLADRDLFAAIQEQYASLPEDLLEDPELLAMVLASHRADFSLVETYRYAAAPPLDAPMHIVGGTEDRLTPDQLSAWRAHTRGRFAVSMLPGGHFYHRGQRPALLNLIRTALPDPAAPATGVNPPHER